MGEKNIADSVLSGDGGLLSPVTADGSDIEAAPGPAVARFFSV